MFSLCNDASISGGALFTALSLGVMYYNHLKTAYAKEVKEYSGSCHCKAVTFTFTAPKHLTIWDCNCSVCFMKKNAHVVIPQSAFKLLTGQEALSLYTFNTKVAKHYFCKHCGVQAFYVRNSLLVLFGAACHMYICIELKCVASLILCRV